MIVEEEGMGGGEEAATALCDHIRKQGFHSHIFSDISISFLGKEYPLHKIVLSQSSYFLSLLSGPWKENGKSRIQLQIDDPNVTVQGLEIALAYLYGVTPVLTDQNVVSVLASGCFLCLDNLCELSVQFIIQDLRVESFITYQQLSERHCYGRHADTIRDACWSFLCTHASRELLHLLPKLSLQVLCRLLKSDEIWVPNEAERHKLAKQALIDWKLARVKATNTPVDSSASKRHKSKTISSHKSVRSRSLRCNKISSKIRSSKRKGSPVCTSENSSPQQKEVGSETDLQKLRRLWEENAADQLHGSNEDFNMCIDLFTGGGIIYAHMEVDELFLVKKELEDANLPSDAIDASIWQNSLLRTHVVKLGDSHSRAASSDDDDLEMDDDEDDDDDDDDEDDEDEDEDEVDYDEEEESSDRDSDDSSSRNAVNTESPKRSRVESRALVCFSCLELNSTDTMDSKRRRTTSGFTWAAKPDTGMRLKDFPPFRFGVEFFWKEKKWNLDPKFKSLFYGGSLWSITATTTDCESGWHFGVHCYSRKNVFDSHPYSDTRKKVRFMARLYIKTASGLWRVTGTGLRSDSRNPVGMQLTAKDIVLDEPLRVSAAVQLLDD
eukprot:Gb_27934 [translate_table: standard]